MCWRLEGVVLEGIFACGRPSLSAFFAGGRWVLGLDHVGDRPPPIFRSRFELFAAGAVVGKQTRVDHVANRWKGE